jgi:hypothetical protein
MQHTAPQKMAGIQRPSTISRSCRNLDRRRLSAMTGLIALLLFVAILGVAALEAIRDMQPHRRPPQWSVARMIEPRGRQAAEHRKAGGPAIVRRSAGPIAQWTEQPPSNRPVEGSSPAGGAGITWAIGVRPIGGSSPSGKRRKALPLLSSRGRRCEPFCGRSVVSTSAARDIGTSSDPHESPRRLQMHQIHREADDPGPDIGTANDIDRRQLEKSVSLSRGEWIRWQWYRLRLTVAEMNYPTRRVVELQAVPASDHHPRR